MRTQEELERIPEVEVFARFPEFRAAADDVGVAEFGGRVERAAMPSGQPACRFARRFPCAVERIFAVEPERSAPLRFFRGAVDAGRALEMRNRDSAARLSPGEAPGDVVMDAGIEPDDAGFAFRGGGSAEQGGGALFHPAAPVRGELGGSARRALPDAGIPGELPRFFLLLRRETGEQEQQHRQQERSASHGRSSSSHTRLTGSACAGSFTTAVPPSNRNSTGFPTQRIAEGAAESGKAASVPGAP